LARGTGPGFCRFFSGKKAAEKAAPQVAECLPLIRRGGLLFRISEFYVNLNCRYPQYAVTAVAQMSTVGLA